MADIVDVARAAGVSTATVSRALRSLPNVSEATRARVLAAAEELDYHVSRYASGLATGRTSTVGVIVPHVDRWFFGQVIAGAEQVLRRAGLDLLLYAIGDRTARKRFFTELPLRGRVDAALVLSLPLTGDESAAMRRLGIPLAAVGSHTEGFASVAIDDRLGARMAVQHLVDLGHRDIGVISGDRNPALDFTTPVQRLAAYGEVLTEAGLQIRPRWRAEGHFTTSGGDAAMARLLADPQRPTAVFAMSDEMAFGALRALRREGLSAPEDVSVAGFDDHEMADLLDLTTVSQDVPGQGARAAERLVHHLGGSARETAPLTCPVRLVVRGSTGRAAGAR